MERNPISLNQEQIQAYPFPTPATYQSPESRALLDPTPKISLDETQPAPTVPLETQDTPTPLPESVAALRAAKANYGLGDVIDKTYDDYYKAITNGQEFNVRSEAASQLDLQRFIHQQAQITAAAGNNDQETIATTVNGSTPTDPNSIFEDAFSVKFVNSIYNVGGPEGTFFNEAQQQIPEQVQQETQAASVYTSKIEFLRKLKEEVDADVAGQSYLGWGLDQLKGVTQFYPELKLRGLQPGVEGFMGLGSNLEEQAKIRLRQPYDQFKTNIVNDIAQLRKDNPSLASQYLESMIGLSSSQKFLNDAFTLLTVPDTFTAGSMAKGLASRFLLFNQTRTAFKQVVAAAANTEKRPIEVAAADATGNMSEAAVKQSSLDATKDLAGKGNPVKETVETLPDLLRLDVPALESRPGRFGQEITTRIKDSYGVFKQNLLDTIEGIQKVERIASPLASEKAIRAIKDDIRGQFRGLDNSILNITDPIHDVTTNTYHVNINLGTPDGNMFGNAENAWGHAQLHGLSGYTVQQDGFGFYLQFTKPINETTNAVRDYLLSTSISKTPDSWSNAFLGWLRTPDETMSLEQRLNRKVATYAPSQLMKVAQETAQEITKLAKWTLPGTSRRARWNDFDRVLKSSRDILNPTTGEKGYFFKSPGELEEYYQKTFNRLPDMHEVQAYFAFTRLVEMDYVLRNLQAYKFASRVGAEQFRIPNFTKDGKQVYSDWFNGIRRNVFPGGEDTILITMDNGKHRVGNIHDFDSKLVKNLREEVERGERQVIEVHAPENRPLQGFDKRVGDARVRYVVTKTSDNKPLDFNQIPRREGGHFDYDYEHYIKQAKIRPERLVNGNKVAFKMWYEGDTTVMPVSIRKMGVDIAQKLDAVRIALLNKDEAAAQQAAKAIPKPWKEIRSWFSPQKDKKGILQPPRLSLEEPFRVVGQGESIIDMDKDLEKRYMNTKTGNTYLYDGTKKGSINQQYQIAYTGQRDSYDLWTLNNTGTIQNPLYALEQAKLVDPIPSLNRALSRITQSTFMDDYKIQAIEHWLREASPYLKATDSELKYSPFYHFAHPEFKVTKENLPQISQLKANWHKINQFTGIASTTNAFLHSASQALADTVYSKFGSKGVDLIPTWMLAKAHDPIRFTRSVVFNMKMGLFSIPQFLVHAMTYVNVMGIAGPGKSTQGALGALLHGWSSLNRNPAILDHLDGIASKFGFRPGEWREAQAELLKTGFMNEAGEYAMRDDLMSNKVVTSGAHQILDAGQMFFRGGVRSLRVGSWYTAYKEFRDLHPTGAISNLDRAQILERADILSHNMTRASNSMLHTGILSIPAQFFTYFLRLAELTTGSRLTSMEKLRLLGVNAIMFGIPTALGITGLPFDTYLRKAAQDNGYVLGDNFVSDLMTNGLPAAMGAIITGSGDPHKGTWYNFAERYGPKGWEMIDEILDKDASVWKIFGGAMTATLANEWAQSSGLRMAAMAGLKGDPRVFPFTVSDALDLFNEVASFSYARRSIAALATGNWINKNGTILQKDVTTGQALMAALTGATDQRVTDIYSKSTTRKEEKEFEQSVGNSFVKEFQRGVQSGAANDPEQAKKYFTRAFQYLEQFGYPVEKRNSLIAEAIKDSDPLIDRMDWSYYLKDVPEYRKIMAMDAFRRQTALQRGTQ